MGIEAETVERMVAWRRDLHAHPELAFQEVRTAELVARELAACGLSVKTGLGRTGVVGTLSRGDGPTVGLRADMDALPIQEATGASYASRTPGVMHACGHDGHVAMLLGAARHLASRTDLSGTVHFIFQPAEECEGGGRAMVEDGLFRLFPCDSVYGLHNWPGLPLGTFATRVGAIMASLDTFEITVAGFGTHAAMPERGTDTLVVASEIVLALQTIVSRRIAPTDPVVLSVTQIHGGDAYNVIPDRAVIRGTVRCLDEAVRKRVAELVAAIAGGTAGTHGARAEVDYRFGYPATVNTADAVGTALEAAGTVPDITARRGEVGPSMASEDFAYMLQACPGAYAWIGTDGAQRSLPLHNPGYDFNDEALPVGAAYWAALASHSLRP
ncbi:peptidase M20 [Methylobacterium radiotolerans]|uniref:M20 aminoacylase family protein n=1 Tax=Methylobacterium sp. TaxID=409 RepID=UPI000401396A|nr:M20 aminoacylase family protein [Methylobacterium sp.]KIU28477.1 peptidase M20 [Methylobacterium radiotolerans]KTS11954.1 peptidase M20 [Methylobacterium radiotolerans]KTS50613.1 peptidase M20 [Methylobacterium radiotolerans]KZC01547.1 putative hydrolase YxeP [Methylobacterium radiotolerans]RUP17891.1 MAG: amidohydrolase [Methylobacterium sp.]